MKPNKISLVFGLVFSIFLLSGCISSPEIQLENTQKEDKFNKSMDSLVFTD